MTRRPRRIVAHMLFVSALQFRHPIEAFIQMKINNLTWCSCRRSLSCVHVYAEAVWCLATSGRTHCRIAGTIVS
jgi:hypothetical protein